jgi:hypothetical protein
MSTIKAPAWAFTAEAIDGAGDTHLPKGVHVRALPSPGLGVPATPLAVYRGLLTPDHIKRLGISSGVLWVDSQGHTLTAPFAITPDNPVYGYFPLPEVVFAELNATPAIIPAITKPVAVAVELAPATVARLTPTLTTVKAVTEASVTLTPAAAPSTVTPAATIPGKPAPLRFEAMANTAQGPAPFQTRHQAPYNLAAWTLPFVRVIGQGTVNGIRWLPYERIQEYLKFSLWEIWSLPLSKPAPRYTPTPNAQNESKDRVQKAGVLRQPLYVAYSATGPSTSPAATGVDAQKRVDQVAPDLKRWLDILLNDLSAPTWALQDKHGIQGKANSSASVPIEPFLLAGAVDPDVGHHLGFGGLDAGTDLTPGSLVFYRIRGLWRWDPKRWHNLQLAPFLPGVSGKADEAVQAFQELKQFNIAPTEKGPFVDLHTYAVALVGSPPDAPTAIQITATEDRGWLAAPPPPNVRRALRILADGFVPHAVAALAATDSNGLRTLHPFPKVGRIQIGKPLPPGLPLPLIVSRPVEGTNPGEGRFEDRDAPASTVAYRLAQGDWFGRWSPWANRTAPVKPRTPPMKPTLEIYPHTAAALSPLPSPIPGGNIAGTIAVRIPIPRTDDLPAGGSALARLDLTETFEGSAAVTVGYNLAAPVGAMVEVHPAPAHDMLVITRTGPSLARGAAKKITYTARWIDALNLVSPVSDPAARTLTDPRPPPAPPVITELRYTARPDVEGHARVDLDFASTVGTRYRVFASNETILLKALENDGHLAAAADIRSAVPGAPRAMKFNLYKALFGWDHFENLTRQPIEATGTTTHFVHRVSASLDVLAMYRVVGEGATGVLSELTESELVPFAVPNLGGPSRPQVSVLNAGLDPTLDGIRLRVKVPRAKAVPKAWRLRRASVPVSDPMRMDLVDHGVVSDAVVERDGTSFEILVGQPLKPWRQYRFAVEVQADDPPGAPTVGVVQPGEWSPASAAAVLAVIPPAEPAAAASVVAANSGGHLKVTMHHPAAASLISTVMGMFRFELWRVEPGKRPIALNLSFKRGTGDTWVATDTASPAAPAGTYVSIRVIDPIGRSSEATLSNPI